MNKELKKSPVSFDELTHTYWLGDKELHGITSTLIQRAFPSTYDNVPQDVLEHAAERGTNVHKAIERYIKRQKILKRDKGVIAAFKALFSANGLTPIAAEYIVSDETYYATPIDIVAVNEKGELCIIDTKTTYKILTDHVTYQTSICKKFFELQNPDLEIKHLYCFWIRVDDEYQVERCELKSLRCIADEVIDNLIECDMNNWEFDLAQTFGGLPQKVESVESYMANLYNTIESAKKEYETIKEGLLRLMSENDIKSYTTDKIKLTRVLPKQRETFDKDALARDYPELVEKYTKKSETKQSIRITYR